jgi:hypothetical protein
MTSQALPPDPIRSLRMRWYVTRAFLARRGWEGVFYLGFGLTALASAWTLIDPCCLEFYLRKDLPKPSGGHPR